MDVLVLSTGLQWTYNASENGGNLWLSEGLLPEPDDICTGSSTAIFHDDPEVRLFEITSIISHDIWVIVFTKHLDFADDFLKTCGSVGETRLRWDGQ